MDGLIATAGAFLCLGVVLGALLLWAAVTATAVTLAMRDMILFIVDAVFFKFGLRWKRTPPVTFRALLKSIKEGLCKRQP